MESMIFVFMRNGLLINKNVVRVAIQALFCYLLGQFSSGFLVTTHYKKLMEAKEISLHGSAFGLILVSLSG